MGYAPPSDIDPAARALIRHKVQRLLGQSGFTRTDQDDLTQELALAAHRAKSQFDATRGNATTFYDSVLVNKVRSIVGHARAKKRDHRCERHLRNLDGFVWRADTTPYLQMKLDVNAALATLPSGLRALGMRFMQYTPAEVSRKSGMTRGKLRQAARQIAEHFETAGVMSSNREVRT